MFSGRLALPAAARRGPFGPPTRLRAIAIAAVLVGSLAGCATGTSDDARTADRRAAIERWNACMERQSAVAALNDDRTSPGKGCEGYRRDVLHAFPPSAAPRLHRMMDAHTMRHVRTRLGDRAARVAGGSLTRRLLSELDER